MFDVSMLRFFSIVIINIVLHIPAVAFAQKSENCQTKPEEPPLGSYGTFQDVPNNDNCALIVFVGGLGRKDTWNEFIEALNKDTNFDFGRFDYVVIHSPKTRSIEDNVDYITTILRRLAAYREKTLIGYSVGGVLVKRFILRAAYDPDSKDLVPDLVVTYATPLATGSLKLQLSKRVRWVFGFRSGLTALERDILDGTQPLDISDEWRAAMQEGKQQKFKYLAVFPTSDRVANSKREKSSPHTVFIRARHLSILENNCSREVLKSVLEDPDAEPRTLECARNSSKRNSGS